MSESPSSPSSQKTLEEPDFPKVLENLAHAAADVVESKDYLTYSTVLDIYLSDPLRYSNEERETLLQTLLDTLSKNEQLVLEIGWDLPALIVPFIDSDYAFEGPIRTAPCVYKVLKIFELLALKGNAKELFLKCTELLSTLKVTDSPVEANLAFKFFDIKLYCIFELIDSCMRRIETLYPSRFLAMTVSNFINSMAINDVPYLHNVLFVLKRVYSFARNYTSPPRPSTSDVPSEELDKILADENYLQRKLLTAFISESVATNCRNEIFGLTVAYFIYLQDPNYERFTENRHELDQPVMERLRELTYSFDMDIESDFLDFYKSSAKFIDAKPEDVEDEDKFTGDLFEKLVVDYQTRFSHSLIDTKVREVKDSLAGSFIIHTYHVSSEFGAQDFDITLHDVICSCIRLVVPGMVHKSFLSRSLQDVAVFWCWYVVHKMSDSPSKLELELSSVPKVLLQVFLQALVFVLSSSEKYAHFRYATLTLLTRILSSAPEEISYNFIIDALEDCPYEYVKASLVGVLRVLLLKDKQPDCVNGTLAKMQLKEKENDSSAAPALPTREAKANSKFINLDEQRMDDILSIVNNCVETTFDTTEKELKLNAIQIPTLSAYLNLLVALKTNPAFDKSGVKEVADEVQVHIDDVERIYAGDEANAVLVNAVNILKVAIQRLSV